MVRLDTSIRNWPAGSVRSGAEAASVSPAQGEPVACANRWEGGVSSESAASEPTIPWTAFLRGMFDDSGALLTRVLLYITVENESLSPSCESRLFPNF